MAGTRRVHMNWPPGLFEKVKVVADSRGVSATALCLGWVMAGLEEAAAARAAEVPRG